MKLKLLGGLLAALGFGMILLECNRSTKCAVRGGKYDSEGMRCVKDEKIIDLEE